VASNHSAIRRSPSRRHSLTICNLVSEEQPAVGGPSNYLTLTSSQFAVTILLNSSSGLLVCKADLGRVWRRPCGRTQNFRSESATSEPASACFRISRQRSSEPRSRFRDHARPTHPGLFWDGRQPAPRPLQSRQCTLECDGHSKKWNRDLMAVCNFRRIWDAHLNGRERPNDLQVQLRNEMVM
jgi:hypothetical protein